MCKELIHVKSVKYNPQHDKMICRYCFEDTGTLIAPCNCEGSNKYVHQECLAKWQYNSILSQSTHPKYQTNIEKICNVCQTPFKISKYSRGELMLNFTGEEIANLIAAGDASLSAGTSASANYEKYWGEMRGYANGLIYNDFKLIDDTALARILQVMGTNPVYPSNGNFDAMQAYHNSLVNEVRQIFAQEYGFSQANVAGW